MNDDRELTDPALDALLRAHSAESPPSHVDAAVLAAAHRAVASAPHAARATHAWRWWMPIAAAAVIGVIVVGILPLSPTIVDERSPVATDAPPKSLKRDAGSAPAGAPATLPDAGNAQRPRPAVSATAPLPEHEVERKAPSPAAPAASLAPSPARSAEAAGALRKNEATAEPREDLLAHPHPADEWIARIRAQRRAGNEAEALRALAGFRQAFTDADARLPPDLREWAAELPRAPK